MIQCNLTVFFLCLLLAIVDPFLHYITRMKKMIIYFVDEYAVVGGICRRPTGTL